MQTKIIIILGPTASGKSALAEAIAYGAGSKDKRHEAFLKKATKHKESIAGTIIELDWLDDSPTSFKVGELGEDKGLVRYLPQGAVEELCSPDHSDELQDQIENVIFQALDDGDKLGASNFNELKKKTLKQYDLEKQRLVKKITDANHNISEIIKLILEKPKKEQLLNEKEAELVRLNKTLPKLPDEDKKAQDDLADMQEQKYQIESVIAKKQQTLEAVTEVESRVALFQFTIEEFREEIEILLTSAGITNTSAFKINLNKDEIAKSITTRRKELKNEIATIKSGSKSSVASLIGLTEDKLLVNNLNEFKSAIEKMQKETKAFESLKLKYQQQKKIIQNTESNLKSLKHEIKTITDEQIPIKELLEKDRTSYYQSYFKVLLNEKDKIEQLYKPLQESLALGSDTNKQLAFKARIRYAIEAHNKSGLDIIDRTRKGNFRDFFALKKILETSWESCEKQDLSSESLSERLFSIEEKFKKVNSGELSIEEQLREGITIEDYYNWLYNLSHFKIESSLKFNDIELYLLSPGQKGIVLLMLYLAIDKEDNRPLIIDQPEENLDSLSVFRDLIQYFRDRKIYRQIIMVTHNANLVVNTDSEQVIIAEYRGKDVPILGYSSGSLENQAERIPNIPIEELEDGIIEQVCNILEGGETAFSNRKRKYQLSDKVIKL